MDYKVKYESFLNRPKTIYLPRKPEKVTVLDWVWMIFAILLAFSSLFAGICGGCYLTLGYVDYSLVKAILIVVAGFGLSAMGLGFLMFLAEGGSL